MKLYKFQHSFWGGSKVTASELDVDEKPNSYTITSNSRRGGRILKSEVGIVNASYHEVYLLENDMKKAVALFIEKFNADLAVENRRHEDNVTKLSEKIQKLEEQLHE